MADYWEEEVPVYVPSYDNNYGGGGRYNDRGGRGGGNFNRDNKPFRNEFRSNRFREDRNRQQTAEGNSSTMKVPSKCVGRIIGKLSLNKI